MVKPLMPDGAPPPLEGVRVVEIASGLAVAYCGRLLAQSGAEVIRIEPPGGDAIRQAGPFKDDRPDLDGGGLHRLLNAGKRSVALDVTTAEGAEALEPLLRGSALLLASWRTPAALPLAEPERMRERFPETTFVSISEFGIDGPYASHQADSHIIEALAGNSYVSGDPDREPLSSGVELADYFGAVVGWIAALAALAEGRGGEHPGFVDVSNHEVLTMTDDHNLSVYLGIGGVRRRFYSRILPNYPSDIFASKDGHIAFVTAGPGGARLRRQHLEADRAAGARLAPAVHRHLPARDALARVRRDREAVARVAHLARDLQAHRRTRPGLRRGGDGARPARGPAPRGPRLLEGRGRRERRAHGRCPARTGGEVHREPAADRPRGARPRRGERAAVRGRGSGRDGRAALRCPASGLGAARLLRGSARRGPLARLDGITRRAAAVGARRRRGEGRVRAPRPLLDRARLLHGPAGEQAVGGAQPAESGGAGVDAAPAWSARTSSSRTSRRASRGDCACATTTSWTAVRDS